MMPTPGFGREHPFTFYVYDPTTRQVRALEDNGSGLPMALQWAGYQRNHIGDYQIGTASVGTMSVSTAFFGTPGVGPGMRPLLFETMVFAGDGSSVYQERTNTVDAAERAHRAAVLWCLAPAQWGLQLASLRAWWQGR